MDRTIGVTRLRRKAEKPAVLLYLLRSAGFIEAPYTGGKNGQNGNGGESSVYYLPANVSSTVAKVYSTQLFSTLDNTWIKIDEIFDLIHDTSIFYGKCIKKIKNNDKSVSVSNRLNQVEIQVDPIIQYMVFDCLMYLESPNELYERVVSMNRNIKHMLGVLSNKNLDIKYTGDRWKCWICNKSNNSILRDITCPQCGDISINPNFFAIQTESLGFVGKLKYGIAKLASRSNTNNTAVSVLPPFVVVCLIFGLVTIDVYIHVSYSCYDHPTVHKTGG